jgi:hypothetical protein
MKTSFAERLEHLLKKFFPSRVSFGDQSYIEFLNREAIRYVEENGYQMEIIWFFQKGHVKGRVLRTADINQWDPPHDAETLSMEKKEKILQKVIEYSRKRGIPLKIKED